MDEKKQLDFEDLRIPWWGYLLFFVIIYFGASFVMVGLTAIAKLICSEELLADAAFTIKLTYILEACSYLLLLAIFAIVFRKHLKEILSRFKHPSTWVWFGIGIAILYGGNIFYNEILAKLGVVSTSSNQDAINEMIYNAPFAGFLYVCILAPIMEELMFRMGIYRALSQVNKTLAFIVTVLLFAFMHMIASIQEGTLLADLTSLPSYLIGAVGLTLVYHKSKSIVSSMITHIVYNTIGFIGIIITLYNPEIVEAIPRIASIFANIF